MLGANPRRMAMNGHRNLVVCTLVLAAMAVWPLARGLAEEGKEAKAEPKSQTTCPVMGGKVDLTLFVDHGAKRIFVCCAGCIETVKKDPAKYITEIEAQGVTLAKTPIALCPKCGEIAGQDKCCKREGRETCGACGLLEGSPGCCKLPKDAKDPVPLCGRCGEVKDAAAGCKKEGQKACAACASKMSFPASSRRRAGCLGSSISQTTPLRPLCTLRSRRR